MDIRTYFNQRAAHWDDGEQSDDQIRRMIAFLSDIQEGMSVLDVACGTGAMFEALRERKPSHITAVDLSEKMIEIAAPRAVYTLSEPVALLLKSSRRAISPIVYMIMTVRDRMAKGVNCIPNWQRMRSTIPCIRTTAPITKRIRMRL